MGRNEAAATTHDLTTHRSREWAAQAPHQTEHRTRTIVIRHGGTWRSFALLCLCLLLLATVLLGHRTLRGLDVQNQQASAAMVKAERRIQRLEAGIAFDTKRRQLLLGMRDYILKANPRVSLQDAYRYAELAIEASEKYPTVDPLLLLAIGIVESGYDPLARSRADARGLYQIWPSTGRLLVRSLGWNYDDQTLYDPEKNTQAAALYLDVLFSTYRDPQMVLAEYNGGPLNAGYFRAQAGQLADETRNYVPRVLALHARLKEEFEKGVVVQPEPAYGEPQREGRTLRTRRVGTAGSATATGGERPERPATAVAPNRPPAADAEAR